jgi:hypothetical protein
LMTPMRAETVTALDAGRCFRRDSDIQKPVK